MSSEYKPGDGLRAWRAILDRHGYTTSGSADEHATIEAALERESVLAARVAELKASLSATQQTLDGVMMAEMRASTERDAALADARRLREVLRSVEWSGTLDCRSAWPACPACESPASATARERREHLPNCALAAALRGDGEK